MVDRELVVAAQRGDQSAFVDLVKLRGGRYLAIAHRILRDVDRAEDALQDALVIAWRDLPSLRDPDRFDAWSHRLLANVCIAQAGRERRRIANLRLLPIDGPAVPDALLSVADRPVLAEHARQALEGEPPTAEAINAAAAAAAAHDIDPPGDIHASSAYRRHLAAVLLRRVLARAFQSGESS